MLGSTKAGQKALYEMQQEVKEAQEGGQHGRPLVTFSKDTIMNVEEPHRDQMKIVNEKDITIEGYQKLKKKLLDLDKLTF